MRPLRLLVLNWRCLRHPQAGGGEVNVFEQAHHWARLGHEVTVVCADPGREHAPQKIEHDGQVKIVRMGGRMTVYPRAAAFLLRHGNGYDAILDVSNGIPFFSPLFSATPSILMVHHVHDGQWRTEFSPLLASVGRFIEHVVVPKVYRNRKVVAVSASTRSDLEGLGYAPESITVIHNGLTHTTVPLDGLEALPGRRILYLGRLKQYKRIDKIIGFLAQLRDMGIDAKLDIAGDGDARPELEAHAERLGLSDRVAFHGFVDERMKARLLASATVFATASTHEGWGISVLEANAYGCPAVAYDVPGLRDAIRNGETGLLATSDQAYLQALATMLELPQIRDQHARAAKEWAASFDWRKSAEESLVLLRRAAEGRRQRRAPNLRWRPSDR